MTRETFIDALAGAGLDAEAASSRAELLTATVDHLARSIRRSPEWAWFVPGRVEILGKHTDYAGGRSLVAAVPRGFAIAVAPRSDGVVRVSDVARQAAVEVDPSVEAHALTGWTNYVSVVSRRLLANFPGARLGVEVSMASDLARAAGLSSSSALVVAVASALIARGELAQRPEWRDAIQSPEDLAGYLGAIESGETFRSLSGSAGVGTQGGSEDHTAILLSQAERVAMFAYAPVRTLRAAPMPAAWQLVVMNSGVRADKAGAVRDRYNRAALAARALLDIWRQATGEAHETLAALMQASRSAWTELPRLAAAKGDSGFASAELARRLSHFVAEDARVPLGVDAFQDADAEAIGELARASQEEADTLLGNQIHETRELAGLAREAGAFAATSFGAGFGGSVWALVHGDPIEAAAFRDRWLQAYRRSCPRQTAAAGFVTRPGCGRLSWDLRT